LAHWTPLPPLPVPGTSAERSGVYQVLGFSSDGRLLVVGANPEAGVPERVPESQSPTGVEVTTPPPRLWAWNTHSERWELAPTPLPCQDLQTCVTPDAWGYGGMSLRLDTHGRLAGTALWVVLGSGSGVTHLSTPTLYRLTIPAS
jgi:hypothetical protein